MTEKTILIVEDEPLLHRFYQTILENYNVVVVRTADDAIQELQRNNSIGLLITGIRLNGGKDGYDLLAHVKDNYGIPSLVVSTTVDMNRAREAGAVDFLEKPFNKATLEEKVKKYITAP